MLEDTTNEMVTPELEAILHATKESDFQTELTPFEGLMRADAEGRANPLPDISTTTPPVVGIIASDASMTTGFKKLRELLEIDEAFRRATLTPGERDTPDPLDILEAIELSDTQVDALVVDAPMEETGDLLLRPRFLPIIVTD